MTILILFLAFAVCLLGGLPILWAMGISTIAALAFGPLSMPPAWLAQQILRGADSIYLASIPLFLFSGELMNRGGLTRRLIAVAEFVFGRLTGGLGLVNVATAFVYGGISGSSTADTSAVAKLMIPAMASRGYPASHAAAITAASGTLGIIVPPSVVFILYGVLTNTSIGGLFLAGVIPGVLIALAFMATTWFIAKRRGYGETLPPPSTGQFLRDLVMALPALFMPVFILGTILSGLATTTEAAAFSVVYALAAGSLVYRELTFAEIGKAMVETISGTGAVMLIVAVATPFAWILTVEQAPQAASLLIHHADAGPLGTVALVVLFLLFIGTWLDLGPAMIVLAPILTPILREAGLAPLQIGVLFTVALGVGLYTPPVGTNLFVVCNIGRVSIGAVTRELVPFWIASLVVIVLLVLFPGLSEWLPGLYGSR
ncbi:C4-dicarboxylate ABC transporter permease [Prosthecomicrobium hirschii]|uniref:TRAP transporter large permease protein n=1 Tax=Prosthecodimorpha hirschii TaxID=665126 RepID=A0A0P6VSF1_9HYPH|nr:TRAP transporter large permease [Prosthecomicrobium hirschii]KPL55692.1 C4-dicarboxylate ABC transporter permease [Prosthecomicrobium hirschii]